jgi:hypothetical protein
MDDVIYSWNFNPLEVVYNEQSLANVVTVVHWQYTATHGDITSTNIGTVGLDSPAENSFITFDTLTKEIVTEWVTAKLGEEYINAMKVNLRNSINKQLIPVSGVISAPWN